MLIINVPFVRCMLVKPRDGTGLTPKLEQAANTTKPQAAANTRRIAKIALLMKRASPPALSFEAPPDDSGGICALILGWARRFRGSRFGPATKRTGPEAYFGT